ncbi:MAG: hypothetical protein AB2421_11905 [Thermotaleaceae bacterium]
MDFTTYRDMLEQRLQRHFDLEKDFHYQNMKIDLLAKYYARNERYIATKKATVYAFENNEYVFVKNFDKIEREGLNQFTDMLKKSIDSFVNPHDEHMSTLITGVVVVNEEYEPEILELVKKFKHHKSFAFGFKGWVDIALVLVILQHNEVITNRKGKEVQKAYRL